MVWDVIADESTDVKAPVPFHTPRLVLRKPRAVDAEEIYLRYAGDKEVTRFLGWPRHLSVEETYRFIEYSDMQWRDCPAGPYLIESREGCLLGGTGLEFNGNDCATTGYVLARDAWGMGYATEALRAMLDVARQVNVRELSAICHAEHAASQHVLEKCGFGCRERLSVEFPNLPAGEGRMALRYALTLC
jgi:ribosomal-protein-alanine N-acetyltransferase